MTLTTGFPVPPASGTMTTAVPPQMRKPQPVHRTRSSRIAALGENAGSAALQQFWEDVAALGTPLIEDVTEDAGTRECTYTFVYRGDPEVRRVGLVTNKIIDPATYQQALLEHLPGTDVWWISLRLGTSWRGSYALAVDRGGAPSLDATMLAEQERRRSRSLSVTDPRDHAAIHAWYDLLRHTVPDPLCLQTATLGGGSVAAGPDAPVMDRFPPAPAGRLIPVEPRIAGGRQMWWHVPGGPPPEQWHTLVLTDGERWTGNTATLDGWSTHGVIPPSVTLLVGSGDPMEREAALTCSPAFVNTILRALADPPAELGAPLSPRPEDTRIAGQSLGGLTALYAQCAAPERFGVSICQSGSFWWPNAAGGAQSEWLTRTIRDTGIRLGHVFLEVGLAEWQLLEPARRIRDVLVGQTRELRYSEFDGGHDAACWLVSLPKALRGSWQRGRSRV